MLEVARRSVHQGFHLRRDVVHLAGDAFGPPGGDHGVDALLHEAQRAHDPRRSLARNVLERAGRVDVGRAPVDLVAQPLYALLAHGPGHFLDVLRRFEDFGGRPLVASTMLSSSSVAPTMSLSR